MQKKDQPAVAKRKPTEHSKGLEPVATTYDILCLRKNHNTEVQYPTFCSFLSLKSYSYKLSLYSWIFIFALLGSDRAPFFFCRLCLALRSANEIGIQHTPISRQRCAEKPTIHIVFSPPRYSIQSHSTFPIRISSPFFLILLLPIEYHPHVLLSRTDIIPSSSRLLITFPL